MGAAMRKTANTSLPAARTAKRQLLQGSAISAGLAALAYGGPALAQGTAAALSQGSQCVQSS